MSDTRPASPRRKYARRALITLGVLLALTALFYAEENRRGARALERAQADWKSAGLLSAEELFRDDPPVAPEQNLLDAPFFSEWKKTARDQRTHPTSPYDKWRDSPINVLVKNRGTEFPTISLDPLFDVKRPSGKPKLNRVAGQSDAAVVANAIEADFPELKELAATVAGRPQTSLGIKYPPPKKAFELDIPSFRDSRDGHCILAAHALGKLDLGDAKSAQAAIIAALRHEKALKRTPLLVHGMIGNVLLQYLPLPITREGLNRHAWTESELVELATAYAEVAPVAKLRRSLQGEAVYGSGMMESMIVEDLTGFEEDLLFIRLLRYAPRGWIKANQANHLDMLRGFIEPPPKGVGCDLPGIQAKAKSVADSPSYPTNHLAKLGCPAFRKTMATSACTETYVSCARIGIALERYRLKKGRLPAALTELTPAYLPEIPTGATAGVAPVYSPDNDGGYTLVYKGEDARDNEPPAPGKDIVWRIAAAKK